jgi:DNA-binding response OmpR family regulator
MKILLLEDELHLRQNIKKFLTLKGHDVDAFENGEELLDNANLNDYDCMILDINTPEIDGFEVLKYIRDQEISTPALFISALTDVKKVLKAFEIGAQEYLKKPFDLEELELRMMKICPQELSDALIRIDKNFSYDIKNRILLNCTKSVSLSSTHSKLLYLLFKNKNTLLTFDMITSYVWEDKDVAHGTILSTIRALKKQLPKELIKNVKGEGYILEI